MTNHAAVSTWHGLNPNPATYGSPLWKVAQGTAVKVQVPVVADRIMNGIGDTNGCVCVIGSVKTVNGHAMPDSTFTWATATMYGTSYQPLFVFPGELKPTDPRPADPGPAEPLPTTGKPVSSGAPRVTGFARVNSTLRCVRGRWGGAAATFTYAWQSRAGRAGWRTVPRSTKATLRVGRAMRTASLRCRVTARNDSGAATATSRAVRVGTPPVRRSTPRVVGTAKVGSKLTCNRGRWSGTAPLRYDYRWERQTGSRWTRVGTAMRHAVTAADRSRSLRCVVTVSNDSGRAVARSASIGVR
jgi:hypothetical protein